MSNTDNTPSTTLEQLIARYKAQRSHSNKPTAKLQPLIADKQTPTIMVIACADARVYPSMILDCSPGDLFIVRNIANLVPPYLSKADVSVGAALEYAVNTLAVSDIIVLGHSQCGGIKALMTQQTHQNDDSLINQWMTIASPVKQNIETNYPEDSIDTRCQHCEKASVLQSIDNLKTYPWIQTALATDQLKLHGWHYTIAQDQLTAYDPKQNNFILLD